MFMGVASWAKQLKIFQTMIAACRNLCDVVNVRFDKQFHTVFEIPDLIRLAKQASKGSTSMLFILAFASIS